MFRIAPVNACTLREFFVQFCKASCTVVFAATHTKSTVSFAKVFNIFHRWSARIYWLIGPPLAIEFGLIQVLFSNNSSHLRQSHAWFHFVSLDQNSCSRNISNSLECARSKPTDYKFAVEQHVANTKSAIRVHRRRIKNECVLIIVKEKSLCQRFLYSHKLCFHVRFPVLWHHIALWTQNKAKPNRHGKLLDARSFVLFLHA